MQSTKQQSKWEVITETCRGSSHFRNGIPNQDHIDCYLRSDGSPPVILALSDGHGSPKSFRSNIGSQIAVSAAISIAKDFLFQEIGHDREKSLPSQIKQSAEMRLPGRIVTEWKTRVKHHYDSNPFNEEESDVLKEKLGGISRDQPTAPEIHAVYGSTLLLAILSNDFLICFQLGDGDILAVFNSDGEVERLINKDDNIANETDSLCMKDAFKAFRFYFKHFENRLPEMLFLSTDGYYNSFAQGEAGYQDNCRSIWKIISEEGTDRITRELSGWLEDYSREGSGDDISLGIILRCDISNHAERHGEDLCVIPLRHTGSTEQQSREQSEEESGTFAGQATPADSEDANTVDIASSTPDFDPNEQSVPETPSSSMGIPKQQSHD